MNSESRPPLLCTTTPSLHKTGVARSSTRIKSILPGPLARPDSVNSYLQSQLPRTDTRKDHLTISDQQQDMAPLQGRTDELYGRGTNLFIISILFSFTAACLVITRLISRWSIRRKLGLDDYAIFLSIVSSSESFSKQKLFNPQHAGVM